MMSSESSSCSGWRVKKDQTSGSTYDKLQWRSLSGDILAETDLSGNNPTEYIYFAGKRIARRDPNGTVYYFLQDHLESTRVITNANGNTVREWDYYPFGGELSISGTFEDPHRFAGMYKDSEGGLDDTLFRKYASNLARWLSPDPVAGSIFNPQSLNRYAYVLNNPCRCVDPLGLGWCDPSDATKKTVISFVNANFDATSIMAASLKPPLYVAEVQQQDVSFKLPPRILTRRLCTCTLGPRQQAAGGPSSWKSGS